jgi:hypothetical protein
VNSRLRIAYVITFDPSVSSGLWDRLVERLECWTELGISADVIIACRASSPLFQSSPIDPHRLHLLSGKRPFFGSFRLPETMRRICPDIVYMRYNLPYPSMIRTAQCWKTVLEVHADDTEEWRHRPLRYRALGMLLRERLMRNISGLVFVDPTLSSSANFPTRSVPIRSISNGIRIAPPDTYGRQRYRHQGPPRLILLAGNDEPWQGFDKFAALASLLPTIDFHIVGPVATNTTHLPPNLTRHGGQSSSRVIEILEFMDIGVGTLAMERINRRRRSPLKVREYIANGLPCIIAHEDPDLAGLEGVLNLDYGFQPDRAAADRILQFTNRWMGKTCPPEMATAVDVRKKESQRISFLSAVHDGAVSNGSI